MQGLQYNERLKQLGLMRLERRRVRSHLIESFKITNGEYDLIVIYFFILKKVVEEYMARNCSRKDSDLILEKVCFLYRAQPGRPQAYGRSP